METKFTVTMCEAVGWPKLKEFGLDKERFNYSRDKVLNLGNFRAKRLEELAQTLKPFTKVRGIPVVLKDIEVWLAAVRDPTKGAKARSVKQAADLMREYLRVAAGHRLFKKDPESGSWECVYVNSVEYHPPRSHGRNEESPPYMTLNLRFVEFDVVCGHSLSFSASECLHVAPAAALAQAGWQVETAELREMYLKDKAKFIEIHDKIGRQFLAFGAATDNVDGNRSEDRWSRYSGSKIRLDKNGEPARVVIDVFKESDESSRDDNDKDFSNYHWLRKSVTLSDRAQEGDEESDEDAEDEELDLPEDTDTEEATKLPEVPIKVNVAVFDLKRHLRLRIHVNQLNEYVYDKKLGDKLVLPKDSRSLVEMLISHKAMFKDIVGGKGGGATILCAGPPGVGKTLTAEVFSEVEARPLYSVQCSQLGLTPDALEAELIKVFARAQRWNAILLLDEADVYVMQRGRDLIQNAIVGVFLRVLEYYNGVLFMTTNRADSVDDAIASRCIARIGYRVPSPMDQKRIWGILAATSGIKMSPEVIDQVVAEHPTLSGRDVKNLLKLASMVSEARAVGITPEVIRFVKRFRPTGDEDVTPMDMPAFQAEVKKAGTISAKDADLGQWYYSGAGALLYCASKEDDIVTFMDPEDATATWRAEPESLVTPAS